MSKQLQLKIEELTIAGVSPAFRPIHYLGSKLRLLDQIRELAKQVGPDAQSFCDLFSGSSTLSYAMSKHYDVTSVDVQEYSRVLASALMSPHRPSIDEADDFVDTVRNGSHIIQLGSLFAAAINFENQALAEAATGNPSSLVSVLEDGSIKYGKNLPLPYVEVAKLEIDKAGLLQSPNILITHVYGGVYFSYQQSAVIDAIRNHIDDSADSRYKDVFLAALISTVSGCVNTIGKQFAQPIRLLSKNGEVKTNLIGKIIGDRSVDILSTYREWLLKYCALPIYVTKGRALKGDYCDVLNSESNGNNRFDIIYADPPYTRDHYSRYYHLIETLCLRDVPDISTATTKGMTAVSRGLYRADRHQSPFCIKSQAPEAFSSLFGAARKFACPLLLSYSPFSKANDDHPRLMDVDHIVELGMDHFKDSTVTYFDNIVHSKLNSVANNKNRVQDAEVIITFLP